MRVLFLTNIPSPYRVDFFSELGRYVDLTVTFELRSASDRDAEWGKTRYDGFNPVFLDGKKTSADQAICPEIIKIIKQGYDHIIVGGYSTPTSMLAIEYMRLHHTPFWIEADGGQISDDSRIRYWLKQHIVSAADGWFSSGKVTSEYLIHYGAIENKIIQYPFTSIWKKDIAEIASVKEKEKCRNELKIQEEKVIVSVGQPIYRKGFDILLRAAALCNREYGFYIVGAEDETYTGLIQQLGLKNIHFVGFQVSDKVKMFYRASDLFVLATREDAWGLVVNEAMAEGLPVITTNRCVAGLELIKNGENGYLVGVDDPETLAEKIDIVMQNNSMREKMSENCLKTIKNWTIENMVRCHVKALNSCG